MAAYANGIANRLGDELLLLDRCVRGTNTDLLIPDSRR